jgi:hypothetical protein
MNPGCPRCGGTMIGDGYKSVRHCENSTEESYFYADPDRGPIYCDMNQTNEPICHPAEPCEHIPQCKASNQTPEELAEQLAKRLATEHLPHPFELSALPLILSAIQSATQPLVRRVEELENSELQLVDQRDSAESALGDAYESVIGRAPEWSSAFGYTNAVDEIGESLAALTARVKELEEQLAFLSVCATENANLHTDKATLTAENAELRKDKERLDWIQGRGDDAKGMLLEVVCEKYTRAWGLGCNEPTAETLRQAIDQARNP